MLTITVDTTQAQATLSRLHGAALQATISARLREVAEFGVRTVAGRTPVRTGALRASVAASQIDPLAWRIASPLDYATVVEQGSKPHEIRPRRARILAFTAGGTRVFARRVHHPGTRGSKMFEQSVPTIQAQAAAIFARVLSP